MNYFRYLQNTPYTFSDIGVTVDLTDITQRAKIAARLRQFTTAMYDYIIPEDDRPDTVAVKLYGDAKYTWIVLLANNIMSLYDWPLTNEEMFDYLTSKYGSIDAARSGTRIYYTSQGDRVDAITYSQLPVAKRGTILTPYEQEIQDNEAKRRIRVVLPRFLGSIEQSVKTLYL